MSGSRLRRAGLAGAAAVLCMAGGTAVATAQPEDRAAAKLDRAQAPAAQLRAVSSLARPGGGSIQRYRQRAGGLPVFDAEVVIADPAGAPSRLVADTTFPGLDAPEGAPQVGRVRAIELATEASGSVASRAPATARLGIDGRSGRLAWEVVVASREPLGEYLVIVDARTGETLRRVRDLLWNASAFANVFDPNPVTAQNGYGGLRDANDKDSPLLTSLRVPVELPRITSANGCLTGTYADARLGKKAKRVCNAAFDFTGLTRADNAFEAVMGYYHVDRTRAYVDSLGLSRGLRTKPQKIRANAIPDDNSFYSSRQRSMTLGLGGVDDGEDADVIVHEYGHSLQDQAVTGFGRSVAAGSIGEGFGDYLAAAMSAIRTGGSEFDACIFDWDAVSYSRTGCGRRADKGVDLQQAKRKCLLEIHCMGEVWSSGLFELRSALGADEFGRSVMDRVVLESNFMLPKAASWRQAARALLAADDLLYGGVHRPAIEAEMVERGLCPQGGC